ncbi:IQ motif and SEC7 domain-containing protein 1 [Halyomorpha halys]|uniref:IQ motif and SEC7 domain-containing protein 1 n=1 Tax=Halyomorpha halys TaxID=286706 RepID=UPI0006D4E8B4|nr:IQ motif and SEC7 domain-containing protein 1 [Halyomorpha halys]
MSNENNQYFVDSSPNDGKCQISEGVCEHVFYLHQQSQYIDDLRSQLSTMMAERDLLLCEVSRLKFELEIADIKRINEDRSENTKQESSSTEVHQNFINGTSHMHTDINKSDSYKNESIPTNPYPVHNWSQSVNKKGSFRNNNEALQRSRVQHVYELSQDLLDKQIEMLERKYGGDKARNAALTIQRAFRHYTLVKKFATITSMAKAEKRFSRRLVGFQEEGSDSRMLDCFSSSTNLKSQNPNLPLRSLSMREKRSLSSPMPSLPRSYSGRCELACYSTTNMNQDCSSREPCVDNKQEESNGASKSRTNRVPPEVPKRTSSISVRSLENPTNINLNKNSDSGSVSSVQSSGSDSSVIPPVTNIKTPLVPETVRKRQYRVGLNLFNKKPERGISYLVKRGFLENSPQSIAQFLITRKGLSKQMIGEYLGNLQDPFNGATLEYFAQELDLSGMQVDVALRKFQTYFRMPGEAQKVERIIEIFSHRYCQCNRDMVSRLRNLDTVFVLAFAIIMLNTDLHTPNLKAERRMSLEDFIKNLRGVDDCCDIDRNMLIGIYERVKANEFKTGSDHVAQVLKVQSTIVGKKPNLALPHRRLVCYCRLYEVHDIYKKERPGVHQREVFLFNDLLVITKILSKKKSSVTYTFRQSFSLSGLAVSLFEVPYYPFGIRLSQRVDSQILITFNARNDHDRCKFVEDIRESISEMDEMENLRIEAELEKQKSNRNGRSVNGNCNENRDSGVADIEVCACIHSESPTHFNESHGNIKRSALSNSLLDIHEQTQCGSVQFSEPPQIYSTSLDQSDSL